LDFASSLMANEQVKISSQKSCYIEKTEKKKGINQKSSTPKKKSSESNKAPTQSPNAKLHRREFPLYSQRRKEIHFKTSTKPV
jgi:hypothetical protein